MHIDMLCAENQEAWFRKNKIKISGKGAFYTCEQTLQTYTAVAGITIGQTEITVNKGVPIILNIEKKKEFLKDQAIALVIIFKSLNKDD